MVIVYFVIIRYKSCELILTEDFLKKVTIRCEIVVDFALMLSDTKTASLNYVLTPRTMTPSIALRSPPPSIGLDGEPETIK